MATFDGDKINSPDLFGDWNDGRSPLSSMGFISLHTRWPARETPKESTTRFGDVILDRGSVPIGSDIVVAISGEAVTSSADIAKAFLRGSRREILTLPVYRRSKSVEVNVS